MLVAVIQEPTLALLKERLASLPDYFTVIELRLDACATLDVTQLDKITASKPLLFTLRPKDQGGHYKGSEQARLETLLELAHLHPAYMDVEYTVPAEWVARIRATSPATRIIISYHDFEKTPDNLEEIIQSMQQTAPDAIYKIATMAHSTLDALRMLVFCRQCSFDMIGICMGEAGMTTRILAPIVHLGFSYCPVTTPSAPGQLSAKELHDIYNFSHLDHQSRIYGLIGNPVAPSIGHLFHNKQNKLTKENAVYVKWQLEPEAVPEAIALLRQLPVHGVSVTMPHKEQMIEAVDVLDPLPRAIGALNTVVKEKDGSLHGYNTDAQGALNALPVPVQGKHVVVLGAGGAAKAIIHTLKKEARMLTVLNRSREKAKQLGVTVLPLSQIETLADLQYDILINTLPASVVLPVTPQTFIAGTVVMDITYSSASALLYQAQNAHCIVVDGTVMFREQALLQRRLWGLQSVPLPQ